MIRYPEMNGSIYRKRYYTRISTTNHEMVEFRPMFCNSLTISRCLKRKKERNKVRRKERKYIQKLRLTGKTQTTAFDWPLENWRIDRCNKFSLLYRALSLRTFGLSGLRTIGPSDYRTFGLTGLRNIGHFSD